jgi:hypothetical protein
MQTKLGALLANYFYLISDYLYNIDNFTIKLTIKC